MHIYVHCLAVVHNAILFGQRRSEEKGVCVCGAGCRPYTMPCSPARVTGAGSFYLSVHWTRSLLWAKSPPNTPQPRSLSPLQQHKGGTDSRLYGVGTKKHILYRKMAITDCSEQKGVLSMTWTQIPCEHWPETPLLHCFEDCVLYKRRIKLVLIGGFINLWTCVIVIYIST